MVSLIGLPGSLRKASFNAALLRNASELVPEGVEIKVKTLEGVPLYNADEEERAGVPETVERLKQALRDADGLLLATPEYNNAIPGVLKNALDWMSRPPADIESVFRGRPVAVLGATPGAMGTVLAQNAWLPILRTLGMRPWFEGRMMVRKAGDLFDDDGRLTDEKTREKLADFVSGFADFCGNQNDRQPVSSGRFATGGRPRGSVA